MKVLPPPAPSWSEKSEGWRMRLLRPPRPVGPKPPPPRGKPPRPGPGKKRGGGCRAAAAIR
eukprot:scaffold30237_cov22-Tisochrysis_lutea.AAC.1